LRATDSRSPPHQSVGPLAGPDLTARETEIGKQAVVERGEHLSAALRLPPFPKGKDAAAAHTIQDCERPRPADVAPKRADRSMVHDRTPFPVPRGARQPKLLRCRRRDAPEAAFNAAPGHFVCT
jgi:hypothetical protein